MVKTAQQHNNMKSIRNIWSDTVDQKELNIPLYCFLVENSGLDHFHQIQRVFSFSKNTYNMANKPVTWYFPIK